MFLGEFLRHPLRTAALAPSSAALADRMTDRIAARPGQRDRPVVVELGAGTGAFTRAIQLRLRGAGTHLAVELNSRMADGLAARHPGVEVVVADAAALPELLRERGHAGADFVVSGLPWAAYAGARGARLIPEVAGLLRPGGAFTQFGYLYSRWAPPARRQVHQLRDAFRRVERSEAVWGNLPPALVYTASEPRPDPQPGTSH